MASRGALRGVVAVTAVVAGVGFGCPPAAVVPASESATAPTQGRVEDPPAHPPEQATLTTLALLQSGRCGEETEGLTAAACLIDGAWEREPARCLEGIEAGTPLVSASGAVARILTPISPGEDDEPCRRVASTTSIEWSATFTNAARFPAARCETGEPGGDADPVFEIAASTVDAFGRIAAPHLGFVREGLTGTVRPAEWMRSDFDGDGDDDTLGVVALSHDCHALVIEWAETDARAEIVLVSDGCPVDPDEAVEDPLFLRPGCFDLDGDGRTEFTLASGPETMRGEGIMEYDGARFAPVGIARYFGD